MRPTDFWTKYHGPQEIVVKLETIPLLAQWLSFCSDVYCMSVTHWRPQDCKTKSLSSKWLCWRDQIWNLALSVLLVQLKHIFYIKLSFSSISSFELGENSSLPLSKFTQIPFTFHRVTQPSLDTITEHCMTIIFIVSPWKFFLFLLLFYLFIYWPWHTACETLVPRPGIESGPLAMTAQSPNHWTDGEAQNWESVC